MYVKIKSVFLKRNVNPSELEKFGFHTYNDGESYWLDIGEYNCVGWFKNTNRFIFLYPRNHNPRKIMKYFPNGMEENVYVKYIWEWVSIFKNYRDYSLERVEKINKRLDELNGY